MMRFCKLSLLLAVGATASLIAPHASATAELTLNDGQGHTASVVASSCGGTCVTATFNGALGDWNINVTTGTAAPGQTPMIDLNSIDSHNASGTASTLTIEWSNDTFSPATPGFQLNVGGVVGTGGTVTATLYGGTSDTLFDLSNKIGTTLSFSNPPAAFSGSENAFLKTLSVSPYALTEVATITFGRAYGLASFDFTADAIPEPASVLLLGGVILLAVSFIRWKTANPGIKLGRPIPPTD
jgi:hypothetical protein